MSIILIIIGVLALVGFGLFLATREEKEPDWSMLEAFDSSLPPIYNFPSSTGKVKIVKIKKAPKKVAKKVVKKGKRK